LLWGREISTYGEEEKGVCCGREISMERRRREFAVGEGDLYIRRGGEGSLLREGDLYEEEEKGVGCGRKISMKRRRREFAVGEGDLYGEEGKGVCCRREKIH
jgi:hypothetical protein